MFAYRLAVESTNQREHRKAIKDANILILTLIDNLSDWLLSIVPTELSETSHLLPTPQLASVVAVL
jgi:hypothetical protein